MLPLCYRFGGLDFQVEVKEKERYNISQATLSFLTQDALTAIIYYLNKICVTSTMELSNIQ